MAPRPTLSIILAIGSGCVMQASAQAQAQLEEVVVTAGLRSIPMDQLPAAVSVIGGDDIRNGAVVHLEELLPQIPSLSWAGASSRPRYFQLRGIGELEQYQGAPNPSIGFLVDEIDFSGIGMLASMFDVSQVEVLRGAQGTRYGANALGGLIKVKTRDPVATSGFDGEFSAGEDGFWAFGVATGGSLPPVDGAKGAWRAVLHRAVNDGFRHNAYLGRDDTNLHDELTARLKFRVVTDGDWRVDLGLLHADFDNGYDAFAIDNSFRTLSDRPGRDSQRSQGASLDASYTGWSEHTVRTTTAWADSQIEASFDADWGNDRDWGAAGPYDFFSRTLRGRQTLSQDLRLMSGAGAGWSWLAGAWISRLEETNRIADDGRYLEDAFARLLDSRYRATSGALYGEVTRPLSPVTTVIAGLRLEQRDASYLDTDGNRFDPRDHMWGGQLSLTHRLNETQNLWASLSRGFKAGGFNIGTSVPAGRRQFDPEYLWSFEAGWKGRDRPDRQSADFNLFYTRRERQQVATSFQVDPDDPLTFLFLTDNAASGEAWGVEASASRQLTPRLQLGSTLSLMKSRYLGYRFGTRDLDGRAWAHAPEWKAAVTATWHHPEGWTARIDQSGEAGFYHDTSHDERAQSRLLTNIHLGHESGDWSVHFWVRNLFDRRYPVRGFYFGNEPPDFLPQLYLRWGDPRQLGITIRYSL